MAQSKHLIETLLAQAGSHPRKQFGQNFMIDQNLVRAVADAGEIASSDEVIEVGPGTGTLTEELLSRRAEVLAVEIDRDLAAALRERFDGNERFRLIEGDALSGKHELNASLAEALQNANARPRKLVANLPYNIASPLVIDLLIAGVELLAFTVQKEVGDRLRAAAGSEAYGPLTVMAQSLGEVEVLRTLPPQAFWPAPKIESALVRLRRNDRIGNKAREFGVFVRKLFASRRKTLRKALAVGGYSADVRGDIDGAARPETLTPEMFWSLFLATKAK
jgi:16S rRNA (adenine1518-N6/adenine1519-N6)-dimethyltransferase